jgi:hypothetical protein
VGDLSKAAAIVVAEGYATAATLKSLRAEAGDPLGRVAFVAAFDAGNVPHVARVIKHLAAENFWPYIGKSEVPLEEPGHLSAVTVAKGIEYGVNLLGCFIEGYVGSNQALGKEAEAHFGKMTQAALDLARGSFATCSEEHNWYEHFELLMRHPVINAGVQIAAWHHYRLPEDLLST